MATEETKPVEREAFEEWAVGYGLSIGVEAGTKLYWQLSTTFAWESWQASANAALERTEQYLRKLAWSKEDIQAWRKCVSH